VWLTPHLRDPQPEGERESDSDLLVENREVFIHLLHNPDDGYI